MSASALHRVASERTSLKPGRLLYLSGAPRVTTREDSTVPGARSHVLGVMRGFEDAGWDVSSFILGDHLPANVTGRGAERAMRANPAVALAADVARLALARKNRRSVKRLGSGFDLVYERFASFQGLGAGLQRRGVPWVLETNAFLAEEATRDRKAVALHGLALKKELAAYRRCDAIVAVSDVLKRTIVGAAGVSEDKVLVVPNGVDTTFFDPARFPARPPAKALRIGFVGHLFAWHGIDLLLHEVAGLVARGTDVSLLVVGDGPMRAAWEDVASSLNLGSRVTFTGLVPRERVPELMMQMDVGYCGHVLPGAGEIYFSPLKMYEYMAMGLPVIAAKAEDSERTLHDGRTGFLFEPENRAALRDTLTRVVDARDRLASMGGAARNAVVERHTWTARVADLLERLSCA
jgi:glycosyltransferase involved in cell wall biosynthesis